VNPRTAKCRIRQTAQFVLDQIACASVFNDCQKTSAWWQSASLNVVLCNCGRYLVTPHLSTGEKRRRQIGEYVGRQWQILERVDVVAVLTVG
jgi:ribosomal protein S27E